MKSDIELFMEVINQRPDYNVIITWINYFKKQEKKQALTEIISIKEHYLRDLKECSAISPIRHWIWVGATIESLEKDISELQGALLE